MLCMSVQFFFLLVQCFKFTLVDGRITNMLVVMGRNKSGHKTAICVQATF